MIDLKNYDKAIRVHSQEELDECYRLFEEAGADTFRLYNFADAHSSNPVYFTFGNRLRFTSIHPIGKETIEYKDFIKELEMEYKDNDILVSDESDYIKVMKALGNNCYVMSDNSYELDSEDLDKYGDIYTKKELDDYGWKLYTEPEIKEMTVEEVSELVGKTVKIVEKKDE